MASIKLVSWSDEGVKSMEIWVAARVVFLRSKVTLAMATSSRLEVTTGG